MQYFSLKEQLKGYTKPKFNDDLLAGLTVAVMLIPQGMAYAMLAGLPPVYGLYSGFIPLLVYPLFGSSYKLSVGPVALVSILLFTGLGELAPIGSPEFVELAILTGIVAGLIQILLSLFRLGFLINFLSHPVILGFTFAAALMIGLSQLNHLMGVQTQRLTSVFDTVKGLVQSIPEIHWPTFILGISGIIVIVISRRISKAIPGPLIAALVSLFLAYLFDWHLKGIAVIEHIPRGLPDFHIPDITLAKLWSVTPLAFAICLISFIESLSIAKTIASKNKSEKINANQELWALGMAKIGGGLFQAFPNTGSFTRTAINDFAGAKTGVSSIIAALFVGLTLMVLTPIFYYLPKAILAAIVIAAIFSLLNVKRIYHLYLTDLRDFLVCLTTIFFTLGFGIVAGVEAGVLLSIGFILYRSTKPHIAVLGKLPDTEQFRNIDRFKRAVQYTNILIFRFDAPIYFGNANYFRDSLSQIIEARSTLQLIILDASAITDIDSTGVDAMHEVLDYCKSKGIEFVITHAIGPLRDTLERSGLIKKISSDDQLMHTQEAINQHFENNGDNPIKSTLGSKQ